MIYNIIYILTIDFLVVFKYNIIHLIKKDKDLPTILDEIDKITLEEVLDAYNFSFQNINEFSKLTGIDYQTLKGWERNGKVSSSGKVTLYYILKTKKLENFLNTENSDLKKYINFKELIKEIVKE